MQRGLLCRAERAEAVVSVVEVHLGLVRWHARGRLGVEEVEGEAEVDERWELADGLVQDATEHVPGHVELLQLVDVGDLLGQCADKAIAGDIDDRGVLQKPDLERQTAVKLVVEEDDLVECLDHAADALGYTTNELVVGEHDDRGGGVAEGLRDRAHEAVAVDEDGVEVLVEELQREVALEVVEADVEVLEGDHVEADVGEDTDEAVVADVELVEDGEAGHCPRDDPAEAVGVDVEEGEVGEEPEFGGQVAGDVGAVEVDAGHHRGVGLVQRIRADDAVVGAHVGAHPIVRVPLGVRVEGPPPCLVSNFSFQKYFSHD